MRTHPATTPPRASEAGFTLAELMVSLVVLAVVLVAMLALFDATNKVAHAETNIAETQQNVRVAQDEMVKMARMAARGWSVGPTGMIPEDQITIDDNVGAGTTIDGSTDTSLAIVPGTDVLHVRGVLRGSMFVVSNPENVAFEPDFTVSKAPPWSYYHLNGSGGFTQDVSQWQTAKDDGNAFKLLLVSRLGGLAIAPGKVESIAGEDVNLSFDPAKGLTSYVAATDTPPGDGQPSVWLEGLNAPRPPIDLVGIVEEYAYYVRDNGGHPRLSLARFQPGTKLAYGGKVANLRQDIADDIVDLQVAMAIDAAPFDKQIAADGSEWWNAKPNTPALTQAHLTSDPNTFYLRITTLGRTSGRDFNYVAPPITTIEDRSYAELALPTTPADIVARSYHRRLLRTTIDLRNF